MSRGKKCSVCASEHALQVNALLAAEVSLKEIAAQTHLSPYALSRHKRNCIAAPVVADAGDDLESQVQKWLDRCDDQYLAAQATGDGRSAIQALTAGVRGVQYALRNRQALEDAQRELPDDAQLYDSAEAEKFRSFLDHMIADASETSYASDQARLAGLDLALEKRADAAEVLRLLQKLLKDEAMLKAVQGLVTSEVAI